MRRLQARILWTRSDDGTALAPELVPLLAGIARDGSLAAAARTLGLSYRGAWGMLGAAERLAGASLVDLARGRGANLTALGRRLVTADAAATQMLADNAAVLQVPLRRGPVTLGRAAGLRIAASHDLVLATLRDDWRQRHGITIEFHGSAESLALYRAREVDVAGFHVDGPASPLLSMLDATLDLTIDFVIRTQGLLLPCGNPRRVRSILDIAAMRLRFVNRQPGSGTRLLLDRLLGRVRVDPAAIDGYSHEEFTHAAVAATIATGKADAGLGLEAAAAEYGLAFVPLVRESYRFACRRRDWRRPALAEFRTLLAGEATREAVARLPGYELAIPRPGAGA